MGAKHLSAVSPRVIAHEFVGGIQCGTDQPLHHLQRCAIIRCRRGEDRHRRRSQEPPAFSIGASGQEDKRLDFRVPPGQLDRLIYTTTRAGCTDRVPLDTRECREIVKQYVHVARECLVEELLLLLKRRLVETFATALPKSTEIHRDDMETGRREHAGKRVPGGTVAIALVKQENTGSIARRVIHGGLKRGVVLCMQLDGVYSQV